jgi:hypothetical protein
VRKARPRKEAASSNLQAISIEPVPAETIPRFAPIALLAVFALQMIAACGLKSPTFDETGDIAAGLSYLQNRSVVLNLQHPPLIKELSALPVWLAGVRLQGPLEVGRERQMGAKLIQANGADRIMWLARLPIMALSVLLGAVVFLWAREMLGPRAALGALFLLAFDPVLLAHGYLSTIDVGFAAFTILFLYLVWRRSHWAICGVAMGLLLAAKFTSGIVVLVAVGLMLFDRRKLQELFLMGLVAAVVLQILYFSPGAVYQYLAGMQMVNRDHNPNYEVFMAGEFGKRFTSYFAVAWLLKEPIATLIASAVGVWMVARSSSRTLLYLFATPVALFVAHTLWADGLGIRYLIPALPFGFLLGGVALSRMPRWAAAALAVWVIVAAIGIWPDHLSYFNEAACVLKDPSKLGLDGGSRCGIDWLDDSNIDWGQGYKQLKRWSDEHAPGRTINLSAFGSFPPEAYGFPVQEVQSIPSKPTPGLWAVSAHTVARLPNTWLHTVAPTAIVGHAIYVYDVR